MTGDDDGNVRVPLTAAGYSSPAFLQYVQESLQQAARETWRKTPWKRKMRARWHRLRHIWGPGL